MYAADVALSGKYVLLPSCVYEMLIRRTTAWAAGNALVFGEYLLKAILNTEPSSTVLEMAAFACITSTLLLHGIALKWGLRIQNALGVLKLFIIFVVVGTGYVALRNGIPNSSATTTRKIQGDGDSERWRGRDNFRDVWGGTSGSLVALCTALYSVRHFLLVCPCADFFWTDHLVVLWIFKCELCAL